MAVYIVTVPDADRQMQAVEVSLEVYQVFIDGHRAEQRERYERRKHLDSRPLECCLYGKSVSETLEETFERMELTEKVSIRLRLRHLQHLVDAKATRQ